MKDLDKISYETVRSWLEGIATSKYKWRRNSQDDIRFDDLEGLTPPDFNAQVSMVKEAGAAGTGQGRVIQFSHTLPFYRRPFAIAASVAILMIAVFYGIQTDELKPIVAGKGQMLQVDLPDGSLVILNSESRIEFDEEDFRNGERNVVLKGEAWFDVQKGGSFVVEAGKGSVEVLGTEFNVLSRPGNFEVVCDEGKVKTLYGRSGVTLFAGTGVKYDFEKDLLVESKNVSRSEWRDGAFYFDNDPIVNVLNELERQFEVSLDFRGNAKQSYTGVFKAGNLTSALDLVCKPLDLDYSIQKDGSETYVLIK